MKPFSTVFLALLASSAVFAADPPFELTGLPPGATLGKSQSSRAFPTPVMTPGQPIETRPPELETDKPAFPGQTRAPYRATVPFTFTLITDRLKAPWSLAFLPSGNMLVSEKSGALRIVDPKGSVSEPLTNVPATFRTGTLGFHEVVLDQKFAKNHRIFFSYFEPNAEEMTTLALASAKLDEIGGAINDVKVIFRAYPAMPKALGTNGGGRILIAKDGTLFMTVGDRSRSPPWDVAQRLDTHLGKIIHLTTEGKPGPGNPFIGKAGALPEIWSIGHRSEQGLTFDAKGRLWETEHGPRGGDELNLIEAGKNYGWPIIFHGIDYPGEYGGLTEKDGMEQPRYYWDPVIAPSGLMFYTGKLFPAWKDSVFVGGLRSTMLDRLTTKDDKVVDEEPLLFDMKTRVRDVREGPEGAIYVLFDDGKLGKLTPKS